MTLWFEWKKPVKSVNTLNPEDAEGNTDDNYITKLFEDSIIAQLIQGMLAHIKTQRKKPLMPERGFTLDQIITRTSTFVSQR